jgi:hypothetical protein
MAPQGMGPEWPTVMEYQISGTEKIGHVLSL